MIYGAIKGTQYAKKKLRERKQAKLADQTGDTHAIIDPSNDIKLSSESERGEEEISHRSLSHEKKPSLDEDPDFKRYMERQREIYLTEIRGHPPSYDVISHNKDISPVTHLQSPHSAGSELHGDSLVGNTNHPAQKPSNVAELPADMHWATSSSISDQKSVELEGSQPFNPSPTLITASKTGALCELPADLPANLPAMTPLGKVSKSFELQA